MYNIAIIIFSLQMKKNREQKWKSQSLRAEA